VQQGPICSAGVTFCERVEVEREVEGGKRGFEGGNGMREVEDNDLCTFELGFLSLREVYVNCSPPSALPPHTAVPSFCSHLICQTYKLQS